MRNVWKESIKLVALWDCRHCTYLSWALGLEIASWQEIKWPALLYFVEQEAVSDSDGFNLGALITSINGVPLLICQLASSCRINESNDLSIKRASVLGPMWLSFRCACSLANIRESAKDCSADKWKQMPATLTRQIFVKPSTQISS